MKSIYLGNPYADIPSTLFQDLNRIAKLKLVYIHSKRTKDN